MVVGTRLLWNIRRWPCDSWHIATDQANSGGSSLEDQGSTELLQYFVPTAGSQIDDISFWFKQDPAVVFGYELVYCDGTSLMEPLFPVDNSWQFYDVTRSLDKGKQLAGIGFVNYSSGDGNGPAWLDDVSVEYYRPGQIMLTGVPSPVTEPDCFFLVDIDFTAESTRRKSRQGA